MQTTTISFDHPEGFEYRGEFRGARKNDGGWINSDGKFVEITNLTILPNGRRYILQRK